jgi:hypothetical protein
MKVPYDNQKQFSTYDIRNQNYEIVTTTNKTENITDVSESTVTHYI